VVLCGVGLKGAAVRAKAADVSTAASEASEEHSEAPESSWQRGAPRLWQPAAEPPATGALVVFTAQATIYKQPPIRIETPETPETR
jgi:hypothetical protein